MFPKNTFKRLWEPIIPDKDVAGIPVDLFSRDFYEPDIPLPRVYTLAWTEPAATGNGECDFPPSDEDLITLPNPRRFPALYNAAIDTIRLSNDFFVKSGCVHVLGLPNGYPKRELVQDLAKKFRKEFKKAGFIPPPDPRTLWVTDKDYHPADANIPWENRLWVVACARFSWLGDQEKFELLTKTNAEQQKDYEGVFKDVEVYNDFLVEMFMTYLAHYEYSVINRAKHVDEQPHPAELDAFFAQPENKRGVTLYDIHRTFFKAQDIKELLRRVERFAIYNPAPEPAFGKSETPEGAYIRRPIPTVAQVSRAIGEWTTLRGLFESLSCDEEFAHGVGSQKEVFDILNEIASPDLTTGHWIRKSTPVPDDSELERALAKCVPCNTDKLVPHFPNRIWNVDLLEESLKRLAVRDISTNNWILRNTKCPSGPELHAAMLGYDPLYIGQVINMFPNRVASRGVFQFNLRKVAYQISEQDRRWLPLFVDPDSGELINETGSRKLYFLHSQLHQSPLKVLDWLEGPGALWTGEAYVTQQEQLNTSEELGLDTTHVHGIGSAEVIDLTSPPSTPKRKRNFDDDGDEASGPTQTSPKKKLRSIKGEHERCAFPLPS